MWDDRGLAIIVSYAGKIDASRLMYKDHNTKIHDDEVFGGLSRPAASGRHPEGQYDRRLMRNMFAGRTT
jgi:hypothetical protein